MMAEKGGRKEKNQNIQVFIRLRPLNQREKDIKSLGVIEVVNNKEVVVRQSHQTSITKKFTFDKAFGPQAKQVEVYQDVVSPLITEVLAGYNCTVFAYGQTGTGKTHTMIGENSADGSTWQNDPLAGIIPRALSQIFDELRLSNTEYTVRVSYLELYNEELFDLLSSSEDNSKLRIYEDVTRKGSNIVHGLEEITVYNKNEVYKIMSQGQERKKVASTLMNAQSSNQPNYPTSSRSHTVFTILIHMKENSAEGEELVKIGKLNLVDLAGSENISKAGSDNPAKKERARECVNINQSLLTLGRVITALVERHPHIPYRESKLTRILQESLGGRTKTSIIATISPGHKDLEETMSTLDYANRAKNIQNKPEVNQKMTKKAILKEYSEEIDRLKRDLQASRDKNGIYLANETYAELTLNQEEQRKEIQELILQKRAMEEEKDRAEKLFNDLTDQLRRKEAQLMNTKRSLVVTRDTLDNTVNKLTTTVTELSEQRHLVSAHCATEAQLEAQARQLLHTADTATGHVAALINATERRRTVESNNLEVTKKYREQSLQVRERVRINVDQFTEDLIQTIAALTSAAESHCAESMNSQEENKQIIDDLIQKMSEVVADLKSLTDTTQASLSEQTTQQRNSLESNLVAHSTQLAALLHQFGDNAACCVASAETAAGEGRSSLEKFVQKWFSDAQSRVSSLRDAYSCSESGWRREETARRDMARAQLAARLDRVAARGDTFQRDLQQITAQKALIEQRLSKQLSDVETEIQVSEANLQRWIEEERRHFEERIERYSRDQRRILEERVEAKKREIEELNAVLKELTERCNKLQEEHLAQMEVEKEFERTAVEQLEDGAKQSHKHIDKFHNVFDESTTAISVEMEAFSGNIVQVVDHINSQLLQGLRAAGDKVQKEVSEAIAADRDNTAQFALEMDGVFQHITSNVQHLLGTVVENVETSSTHTAQTLHTVSAHSSLQSAHATACAHATREACACAEHAARTHRHALHADVDAHAQLEGRYLAREYARYTPTGNTPSRPEYSYPRSLTVSSPHERILQRFRAMRQDSSDDDCIVVESDKEKSLNGYESEHSGSDDSALFATPSPPEENTTLKPPAGHHPLLKCSSETNIYDIRKQQNGKENQRTQSSKKPSKLPAPQSHKKPLCDRNADS